MENASKALLIAGGVLLMIMVLSFATLIFSKMGSQTSEFYEEINETEIYQFNQQFFNYDKRNIKIHDVVSIINLAKDSNERGRVPVVIEVMFNGSNILDLDNANLSNKLKEMLEDNLNNKSEYFCNVEYASNSNYVGKIIITKK